MAFSGQYAAAQLEKLDNSPLFRGYTFPLAAEVSDYLGNVTALMPPTLLHWSRVLGRLVATNPVRQIIVLTDELDGLDCEVEGTYTEFVDGRWCYSSQTCTMDEHHREGHTPIYDAMINTPVTDEDYRFYFRWAEVHNARWPYLEGDIRRHPAFDRLAVAFRNVYDEFSQRGVMRRAEINRRNRAISYPERIVESDSESYSELESDEEL